MVNKILLCLALLIISCATAPVIPVFADSSVVTKRIGVADLQFSIDGVMYTGLATVSHKVPRTFKFNIPKETERLVITTCHRSQTFLNPKEGWYEWLYQPRFRLEDSGFCLMFVETLTAKGVQKSAEIDFTDATMNMAAFSTCNGIGYNKTVGATMCQAPVVNQGLMQLVQMPEAVDAISKDGCAPMKCDNIWCYYVMTAGDCWYRMVGLKSKQAFRLVTRGYTEN